MMNFELVLHVDVLEGQQGLDIVQPSVHFDEYIRIGNFGQKDRKCIHRAGIEFVSNRRIAAKRKGG